MKRSLLLAAILPALAAAQGASTVQGSKHDLSATGPGSVKALTERDTCIFCHVSHGGRGVAGNRPDAVAPVQPYESSTMAARTTTTPTGATRVCLSCHDGTIALGDTRTRKIQMAPSATGGRMPQGSSLIGTDLRGTHPVSFRPVQTSKVRDPARGDEVRLDRAGEVQCTSCHDPHREFVDGRHGKFLVKTPRGSALCLSCHGPSTYQAAGSAHATATGTPPRGVRPAAPDDERSIADAGCGACHQSHATEQGRRLVKPIPAAGDDRLCLDCHDGLVARLDLARQVGKPFSHAAPPGARSWHDAGEGPQSATHRLPETTSAAPRHVACVDCHNPHAATTAASSGPRVSGALAGVWGINRHGQRVEPVQFGYEVCFKCHADSANQPQALGPRGGRTLRRAVTEVNLRRALDPSAPSFHPVVAPGRNPNVPSLVPPLVASSVIDCGDCHGSDEAASGNVPRGPHGSSFEGLLVRGYSTRDGTADGPEAYGLCYKCHDRDVLRSDRSTFPLHARHLDQGAPCSSCHDSHGVSAAVGNLVNNAHLVNFDVSIVAPNAKGQRRYTSQGPAAGSCALSCHKKDHDDLPYGAAAAGTALRRAAILGGKR